MATETRPSFHACATFQDSSQKEAMDKEEFSKHVGTIVDHGMVSMAIGIGHDLGLVKLLCDTDQPISLTEVAEKLNLKERYTKEWMSAMVAARLIEQDRDTRKYFVPQEHRAVFRERAAYAAGLSAFVARGQKTKECFKKEGPYGFGFDECPEWFIWLDQYRDHISESIVTQELIPRFQQQGLVAKFEAGIRVLDLGCGAGTYTIALAKYFPQSTFVGVEYAKQGLEICNDNLEKAAISNASFEFGDAHDLPEKWTGHFDCAFVSDVLHDLPNPHKALKQIYKVLKPDGCMSLVECGHHSDPIDNVGNTTAAMNYSASMVSCLPSSMSEESKIGYGAGWGLEEIQKALEISGFKLQGEHSVMLTNVTTSKVFFYCTK